jgi:5-methylcytosine-specific restriction endonuclease McrA
MKRRWRRLREGYWAQTCCHWAEFDGWLRARGFILDQSFWEADHITAVVEGGGACGLDNIRTLCRPCHLKETAALAARRAKERTDANSEPLPRPEHR